MATTPSGWSGGRSADFAMLTLARAAVAAQRTFVATLAPFALPPQQFSVLLNLVEHPGISQAELSREVMARPQSVGEVLRTMEAEGLVERTAPAGRGLPSAVYASAEGRALLDEVTPHVLAALSPASVGLDRAGYERLNADLHTVLTALDG